MIGTEAGTKYIAIDRVESAPECSIAIFFCEVAGMNERNAVVLKVLVVL